MGRSKIRYEIILKGVILLEKMKSRPIQEIILKVILVCGRLVAGIAGSNPARGINVCLLCLYVVLSCIGRGLCDGLITRPGESYRVSNCVIKRTPICGRGKP
jgi:hypothetical protein